MTRRRRRTPPRVLRHLAPCPDCCAIRGHRTHHEATCPLGNAVEAACDADREYFEAHPDEWHYTRAISAAELQTMEHVDPPGAATNPNHVHVMRVPGGRLRQFCNSVSSPAWRSTRDEEAS